MASNFFAMISRLKYIDRWALMRNTHEENLSEHCMETACIAHALAVIGNRRFGKYYNVERAALLGLYHDAPETLTGDMPTPIKYYNDEIKTAYKQIEAAAGKTLTDMLPEDLKNDFAAVYNPDSETEKIVKAADKLSALIKCIEELNMGNMKFSDAKDTITKAINDMNCPEADAFLTEFIPSFSLSLDKQRKEN